MLTRPTLAREGVTHTMGERAKAWSDAVVAILGFLGGLLSYRAAVTVYRHTSLLQGLVHRGRMWGLARKLEAARSSGDVNQLRALEFVIPVLKLCSPNEVDQALAIAYLEHIGDERAVEVLAARLGTRPELSPEIKAMVLVALKRLLRSH